MTILQPNERQGPPEWLGLMLALVIFAAGLGVGLGIGACWQMHKDKSAIRAKVLSEIEMSEINNEENWAVWVDMEIPR